MFNILVFDTILLRFHNKIFSVEVGSGNRKHTNVSFGFETGCASQISVSRILMTGEDYSCVIREGETKTRLPRLTGTLVCSLVKLELMCFKIIIYWVKEVPVHEIDFVAMTTAEVKCL